jgi:heme exporter protein A
VTLYEKGPDGKWSAQRAGDITAYAPTQLDAIQGHGEMAWRALAQLITALENEKADAPLMAAVKKSAAQGLIGRAPVFQDMLALVARVAPSVSGGRPGAYIGHANALKDDLTVTESLTFLARLHGLECQSQRINAALRTLAIHHRRHAFVRTLSQGQRRRVALARLALESEPSVWILDEPFDALDTQGIEAVNQLLAAHLARGGSVLLTSHLALSLPETPVTELEFPVGAPA